MRRGAINVDSTVWVDYFRGTSTAQTIWLEENLDNEDILVTDLSLCEVLQGFTHEAEFHRIKRDLLGFGVVDTGGQSIALLSADNYRALRKRGVSVRKTIDCIIATYCIENDLQLLHNDRDFDGFEKHLGLRVIHPPRVV